MAKRKGAEPSSNGKNPACAVALQTIAVRLRNIKSWIGMFAHVRALPPKDDRKNSRKRFVCCDVCCCLRCFCLFCMLGVFVLCVFCGIRLVKVDVRCGKWFVWSFVVIVEVWCKGSIGVMKENYSCFFLFGNWAWYSIYVCFEFLMCFGNKFHENSMKLWVFQMFCVVGWKLFL